MGVLGQYNRNLRLISQVYGRAKIVARGDRILIEGEAEDVEKLERIFGKLVEVARTNRVPSVEEVRYLIAQVEEGGDLTGVLTDVIQITHWGEPIRPKTAGQRRYIEAIKENDVVFAIGPAGTGKTYLAVAMALNYLQQGKVKRIVLTRPAVEAGEQLGFLPGDIFQKVNPYLRPLYDALYDMIPAAELEKYMQTGRVEIAPLAFMRGRTLNNAFIILDEAQNTTHTQMKMFLTRLGFGSKAVVTGDITQIDLVGVPSGLVEVPRILAGIPGIAIVYLDRADVVRHPLVKAIIEAYERAEREARGEVSGGERPQRGAGVGGEAA
ncbi:MAG: PhoH family protein [Candidatus Bipolaricaulota bacterium]|nr:PhoH family protein [Candidatus Bipolaricaulota bacterium]MCX7844003.1 PhoH family protein [Candidatus Bipolaricaulota bacterium]MDW8151756.1 PhoH family protein [Candidatus Bipolaricaulota bacterium]